jgi:Fe-S-cluster containining protein
MSNKCLECSAKNHCCKNGFAFVGIDDAKKIKEVSGKEYSEFLNYSQFTQDMLTHLKESDPSLESNLRSYLITDNRLLRLKKSKGQCIFLKNGECSIYENRPKICQMYPYWCMELIDGTIKVINHDDNFCLVRNQKVLSADEEDKKRTLFREIIAEAHYYKKNIVQFAKESQL